MVSLINTLDMDSVLLPGHVSPYVLPGAFAVGETRRSSGKDLIAAVAVSHEMSYRFGAAMSLTRDYKDGKVATPPVVGYTSTIFGATASAAKLKGLSADKLANALGIAAAITPVNAHRAWLMHAPATTIKYVMAGRIDQRGADGGRKWATWATAATYRRSTTANSATRVSSAPRGGSRRPSPRAWGRSGDFPVPDVQALPALPGHGRAAGPADRPDREERHQGELKSTASRPSAKAGRTCSHRS